MMAEDVLTTQRSNDVLILTLNRPEALNALNSALMLAIEAFGRSMLNDPARVLVIRGAGRHFCAGADLESACLRRVFGSAKAGRATWRPHAARHY